MVALYDKMNQFLANELVLNMKIHNIHWFIQGDKFFPIHEVLDSYYEASQARIDVVAEQLLMIGSKPLGTLGEALELTTLEERKPHWTDGVQGIMCLIPDYDAQFALATQIVSLADEVDDFSTADVFTAFLNTFNKTLWMLQSYVK